MNRFRRALLWTALASAVAALVVLSAFTRGTQKTPLPPGSAVSSPPGFVGPGGARLLVDATAYDPSAGRRVIRQEIFEEILAMVDRADSFLVLDLFLWNPWTGRVPESHRALSGELAQALILKKSRCPDLPIVVLADPINRVYGSMEPEFFGQMAAVGIRVVFTPLEGLPDSNPVYASLWGPLERFAVTDPLRDGFLSRPRLDNPFDRSGPPISLAQFGRMLLFKANHRKVVVAGSARVGIEALVGSLNPADGSSAHSNMALLAGGPAAQAALASELALIGWAAQWPSAVPYCGADEVMTSISQIQARAGALPAPVPAGGPGVSFASEGAIAEALEKALGRADKGDEVRIAMFYLSDRPIVEAIVRAADRGAAVRLILDANRDAFGMRKIGVPNRPVAAELLRRSDGRILVRWADTHGEQYHTKALSVTGHGKGFFTTGSANWTRRNLRNLNLEANILVEGDSDAVESFNLAFDRAWDNGDGLSWTLPYEAWRESGVRLLAKTALYRLQEWSGMSTF